MKFRKLIEGVEIDSLGNQLTLEQSKYFANSKIRDNSSNLLVCYHRTDREFTTFDKNYFGSGAGTDFGVGFYFSAIDKDWYGDIKKECYLNITNPFYLDVWNTDGILRFFNLLRLNKDDIDYYISNALDTVDNMGGAGFVNEFIGQNELTTLCIENGYDGIVVGDIVDGEIIAFEPEQIKTVNSQHIVESITTCKDSLGNTLAPEQSRYFAHSKVRDSKGNLMVVHHGTYNSFDSFAQGDIGFHFGSYKSAVDRKEFKTHSWTEEKSWLVGKYYLNITNPFVCDFDYEAFDGVSIAVVWLFGTSYDGLVEFINDGVLGETYVPREFSDAKSVEIIKDVVRRFASKYDGRSSIPRDAEPNIIMRNLFLSKGFDGIEYYNSFEDSGSTSYVAFNPEQIKSIANKTPTSSKNMNEDIWDSSRKTYQPKNDAKFRRLIKKPLNTLTAEDIKYIYTIYFCDYMRLCMWYDSISDALNDTNDRMEDIYFQECADFFQSLSFPLTVYRAIRKNEFVDGKFKISGKNNSISWSTDINIYSDKSSKFCNVTSIVACEVEQSDIDVMHTVSNFIYYSSSRRRGGYGEYEITMKKSFSPSEKNNLRWVKKPIDNKNLNEGADSAPALEDIENLFSDLGYDNSQQINHSVFIFPDGKAFYGNTHEDFYIELCDRGLIDDYYDDFLVTKYNCIRCCDIDDYENYVELPKTVTMKQLYTLEDWLNKAENRYCYDHLQICSRRESFIEKVYDLNALRREGEDVVRYIMNRIKRFVSSGVLLEGTLIAEPNTYVDFINELHSTFNSMSTEQLISFLNITQRNDLDTESPMYILPNGKFVSVQETLDANGVDVYELTHQSICECFAWCLMSDLKYDADTVAEIVDQDWRLGKEFAHLLSELTYKLGWARINCGTKAVDDRFYCVLPNEVTNKQWWSLENWLEWGYDHNKSDVLVFVTDNTIAKKFKMNDFAPVFPEEIIKNIRRFYSSGRFYESVSDKKLTESLQRLDSNAFITDSPYQIRDLLVNKPKLYRILYDSNIDMYMIGDGEEVIHWDLIKAARKQGYYEEMESFIDELGDLENYVEFGEGGQFIDDEEIESYLIYMVFSPDEDSFYLGEDGYQFKYPLSFGTIYTRDSYLDDCDLYKVVKATNNIGVNEKMENNLLEGIWSLPDTQGKVDTIKNLFANPITADDVDAVKDILYVVFGSDELFDILDGDEDIDYRDAIASYIESFLDDYPEKIDTELEIQLNNIIKSYDSFYGSDRFINEGIIHTDENDNVNSLKLGGALTVGDVFYDDRSQHKMKVLSVSEVSSWAVLVTVEDLVTGATEERRLGTSSIVELAGENDIEVEVDDDIEIEWHPIDDYFDRDI